MTRFVEESFAVCDNIGLVKTGEYAHLIKSVFLFFLREVAHLNFLEGVKLAVLLPLHLEYTAVCSVTYTKVMHPCLKCFFQRNLKAGESTQKIDWRGYEIGYLIF